jgi:CBS domain containing-hemolysin-like protein
MLLGLASIFLLILAAAFFVASEYALVSVRKTRIEQLVSEGNNSAVRVKFALEHLDRYIASVQIGVTIATLGLGALGEPVLATFLEPYLAAIMSPIAIFVTAAGVSTIIAFMIVTVLEIVLGEIVPKIIARQRAERISLMFIRPLDLFTFIVGPLVWVVNSLSNVVLRLLGVRPGADHGTAYTIEELEMLVASSRQAGVLDQDEEVILRRVFDFGDLTARQVMRPRTEIFAIEVDDSLDDIIKTIAECKHSRLPVYEGNLDHIIGVLHVKDVFMLIAGVQPALATGGSPNTPNYPREAFKVRDIMRPIDAVPETLDVADLLNRMLQHNQQMVVVVDEYGGTAGIVTLEDIVEEIVGEVHDEFEPSGAQEKDINVTPEGTFVNGLTSIDDVNEALGLDIESEADTIGGFVFETLGRKPELGDEVSYDGIKLRVEALDGLRVARVRIIRNQNNEDQDAEAAADES